MPLHPRGIIHFLILSQGRTSQLPVANWYETLDSNVSAADAILDRVVNTASRFTLKGDSLRKNINFASSEL